MCSHPSPCTTSYPNSQYVQLIFSINVTSASYPTHSTNAVGGPGIDDQSRELGFGWTDTRFNRELFAYFRLQRKEAPHRKGRSAPPAFDNFEEIVGCIEANGVDACLQYAEIWRNTTLPPPQV